MGHFMITEAKNLIRQKRIHRSPSLVQALYDKNPATGPVYPSIAEALGEWVPKYVGSGSVIEFGCGTGRNLHFLRSIGVAAQLIGLDFSQKSINIALDTVDAKFFCRNVLWPIEPEFKDVDVIFTVHAMEMMPRDFAYALKNIQIIKPRVAVFIEPIAELWPWTPMGLLARYRVYKLDRLRGFYEPAKQLGKLVYASRLADPYSRLNPSCIMVVEL